VGLMNSKFFTNKDTNTLWATNRQHGLFHRNPFGTNFTI